MRHIGRFAVLLALFFGSLFFGSGAQAVTYVVPPDREMIQLSDDIVIATGVTSLVERAHHGGIVTRYTLRIDDVLKGRRDAGDHLVLTELGGRLGDQIKYLPGTPEYQPGVRYLVFTDSDRDGEPVTFGVGLGQFFFATYEKRSIVVRAEIFGFNQNFDAHVESARDTEGFLEYIRAIVAQKPIDPEPRYFIPGANPRHVESDSWNVVADATRSSYLVQVSGRAFRWQTPVTSMVKSGTAVGVDGEAAVALTFSQWNGTASNINYSDGGVDNTAVGGVTTDDGKNAILFDDPNNEVGSGIAGRGGISSGGAGYTLDGELFWNIFEIDAVMNNGPFAQNCFNTVMVHEIGHTLAFRHSNEPPAGGDSTTDAVMNSIVQCSWNGVLKTYDHTAASTVYGAGPVCVPPSISTHPPNRSIAPGATTNLSVVAGGTSPFTYQWFIGSSGDTSLPTGTNSSSLTVSPTVTTSYWVRVTGQCEPPANSNTATVTVTCNAPSITAHPTNRTIASGSPTTLSVTATGTGPLTFQWFIGSSGDTSLPTGTNSNSLTVSPTVTTSYWVRVTGQCGSPAMSNTATVSIAACVPPGITSQPTSRTITEGGQTTLTVAASGTAPLTFQWFLGSSGNTSQPTGTNSNQLTVSPTITTQYWVRVTGQCAPPADSVTATVTVNACPVVTLGTPTATAVSGGTSTLSITASSAASGSLTYAWFRGTTPGVGGTLVGSTRSVVVPITASTSFWVRVTNSCGVSAVSTLVTVAPCVLPTITTQPADQTISSGGSTTLSIVVSAGSSVTWYRGNAGDKNVQVGTGTSVNVGPLTATTSFWAAVSNSCGEIPSRTTVVTVQSCTPPVIVTQPLSQTVNSGTNAVLSVTATGTAPLQYQWFEGTVGNTDKPVGSNLNFFVAEQVKKSTTYWVRVSNACDSVNSNAAVVSVPAGRRRAVAHR